MGGRLLNGHTTSLETFQRHLGTKRGTGASQETLPWATWGDPPRLRHTPSRGGDVFTLRYFSFPPFSRSNLSRDFSGVVQYVLDRASVI